VFSPYYALARRRRGRADPERHVAVNAILYLPRGRRWSMTERSAAALQRSVDTLVIGPSALRWQQGVLTLDIQETTVPWPHALKGQVRVVPRRLCETVFALDRAGEHNWQPLGPDCHVEVDFEAPALSWHGRGYLDHNNGRTPLEQTFTDWWWARGHRGDTTYIQYEAVDVQGRETRLTLTADAGGTLEECAPWPRLELPRTGWRLRRPARTPDGMGTPARTLEDTPFYARSLLEARLDGQPLTLVHEALDLRRFAAPWVQLMLPFRMPRRAR
jgi:carotenoid 1,2-hydratase